MLGSSAVVAGPSLDGRESLTGGFRQCLKNTLASYKRSDYDRESPNSQSEKPDARHKQPGKSDIRHKEPQSLKDLLAGNDLARLVQRAHEASELDAQVRALLPEDLAAHVTGAVLHDETVVILVDSAAWASRLRFHVTELVQSLAPRYDGAVARIRVKVRPPLGGAASRG
jgi:hypothetical protein